MEGLLATYRIAPDLGPVAKDTQDPLMSWYVDP